MDNISSIKAEQSILAYSLENPEKADLLLGSLTPDDFFSTENRTVFLAATNLLSRGLQPNLIAVSNEISTTNAFFNIGYLYELAACSGFWTETLAHKDLVIDFSRRREFIKLIEMSRMAASNREAPYDIAFAEIISKINSLSLGKEDDRSFNEAAQDLLALVKADLPKLPTGFSLLDNEIIGLESHAMTVLGGATGTGKTTFALTLAVSVAVLGFKTYYYSLEMPSTDLLQRSIPLLFPGLAYRDLIARKWTQDVMDRYIQAIGVMEHIPLRFISGINNIDKILAKAKADKDLKLVIIDHLQLLEGSIEYESLAQTTAKIKQFCLKENKHVILLSQLNNESQKRHDPTPKETDFRGSGTIIQDADIALALFKLNDEHRETYLKIVKNRKAPTNERIYFSTSLDIDSRTYKLVEKIPKPTLKEDSDLLLKKKRGFYGNDE